MLSNFGFSVKWLRWIKACVCKASLSVMVNGSPTSYFMMEKGLRQGDPLSPFLFTLVTEGLAMLVSAAVSRRNFKGFSVSQGLGIISKVLRPF